MIGKVPPDDLREVVFAGTGADDDAVVQGPAYGEDAAAVEFGDQVLVVSADPISLAAGRVGTLGVHVACNDVAACGATPRWLTNTVFLPDDDPATLRTVVEQVDRAAREAGVAVIGGHAEYAPERNRPLLALTCLGVADDYVPSSGARPGDVAILTKGAAIEGTAILATDFRGDLAETVPESTLDAAAAFFDDVSVVPEATVLREFATAMHDPTEGGLVDGAFEMAAASGVTLALDRSAVPVRPETAAVCEAAGVDPLSIFGSGALLATVPADAEAAALDALSGAGVEAATVGRVTGAGDAPLTIDGEPFREPVRDGLYALWE